MKVVLLCTVLKGGAGGSAQRLHNGLLARGIDSSVLVRSAQTHDQRIIVVRDPRRVKWLRRVGHWFHQDLDSLPLRSYPSRDPAKLFSTQWVHDRLASTITRMDPDIVNLRWIGGFMRIETLARIHKPVVWTLSDMWPFTGGCYIPQDCEGYQTSCGRCPHLASDREHDLSHRVWRRKSKAWRDVDLTIATPSKWMAGCVKASALFKHRRVEIIPSAVDTDRYRPMDRWQARSILGLPEDKTLVLFAAWRNHVHKGFHLLAPALKALSDSGRGQDTQLVVFGFDRPDDMPDIGMPSHFLGRFSDVLSKSIVYSAADVFVAPSTQDNFANTVLEATSCGVPTVAFTIGGMPDIIDHERTGYVAEAFDTEDLARGIAWVVKDRDRRAALGRAAREKALNEFTLARYAERYARLFQELLQKRNLS